MATTMHDRWAVLLHVAELVIAAADNGTNPIPAIDNEIGLDTLRELISDPVSAGLARSGDGFFDQLDRRYSWLRQFTPAVIDAFEAP